MRPPENPPDGEARLLTQLEAASNLAHFGAVKLGREVCAAIFLNYLHLLATDRAAQRRFVECLLLLGMTNLLTRLLRALEGVELEVMTLAAGGSEQMIFAFSNGCSLNIPRSDLRTKARAKHAAKWSEQVLDAAARPSAGPLPPMPAPGRVAKRERVREYERLGAQ